MDNPNSNDSQNANPTPQRPRRNRNWPLRFVEVAPGRMEPMFDDQYQAMRAAEEAAKQARRVSLEAERAAGRDPSVESPGGSPNQQLSESSSAPPPSAPPSLFRSPDFSRHSRHCSVCSHPDRDAIEAEFIRWRSPHKIAKDYDVPGRSCLYRHAHATGLFPARKRHVNRVIESFLETIDDCPPADFDPVTRAVRAYAHLDDDGKWFEPDRTLRILTGPFALPTSLAVATTTPPDETPLPDENAIPQLAPAPPPDDLGPTLPSAPDA